MAASGRLAPSRGNRYRVLLAGRRARINVNSRAGGGSGGRRRWYQQAYGCQRAHQRWCPKLAYQSPPREPASA
jgi:hypothetical protein